MFALQFPANRSDMSEKPKGEVGPSLGQILAWLFLVCCIIYCIGIGYYYYSKTLTIFKKSVFLPIVVCS